MVKSLIIRLHINALSNKKYDVVAVGLIGKKTYPNYCHNAKRKKRGKKL